MAERVAATQGAADEAVDEALPGNCCQTPRPFSSLPLRLLHGMPAYRTELPRDHGWVAAFVSAHRKAPYTTPSMEFSPGEGVVRGIGVQQQAFA